MAGIKDYSTTQANNTDLNGISTAEGMLPSNLNNAIRALMKNTREWYNDSQWVIYGDGDGAYTSAYVSANSFTIAGTDVTAIYHANRRIKAVGSSTGTIYGTISTSSFSTDTTVVVTWDSGSLQNESLEIYIGGLSATNTSLPNEIITTAKLGDGSVTTIKIAADAINGSKIADDSIDSEHYVDGSIDTAHIADSQITTAKIADTAITTSKITDANVTTAKIADSAITSAKISDGTIVNADVNASAAIDATKIHDGTVSNTEFGYIGGLTSDAQTQLDAKLVKTNNLSDITSAPTARSNLGLGTIATQDSNNVSVTGGSVTGLGEPSSNSDAATKSYVDQAVAGLRTRIIAEAATTANIDLTADLQNGDIIDGVTLATGDRVLVKDQTDATANGLYIVVATGTASRDPQFDTIAELSGQMIVVNQGSSNDDKIFLCTTDSDATIGVSNITYTQVTPSNSGTVTSVGVADSGAGEFTVTGSPVTAAGTINLALNTVGNSKLGTGIDAAKLADGTVSNTEFQYINSLTSNAQTQLNAKLENVSEDTTPQLGGNLDVNGNSIVSTTNGNISITPDGTGKVILDGLSYPTADGTVDQILKTDGAGNLSFADASGGGTSWQSVKTADFNAVAGEGYFVNTSGGAITATLPASPSIGDTFYFKDYAQTFNTNNLSIDPNGNPFEGLSDTLHKATQNRMAIAITYSDSTKGYVATASANAQADVNTGDYNIVAPPYDVDFLVIAGGGGAGGSYGAGAGGAGGYRNSYGGEASGGGASAESSLSFVPGTVYTITVGGGAAPYGQGGDSSISGTGLTTITSLGGGQGGPPGAAGGSGGAGSGHGGVQPGGAGTANQGRPGGNGSGGNYVRTGGGGGGAANSGNAGTENGPAGNGGNGVASTITGSSVTRGGGGGGGAQQGGSTSAGSGGSGGGGNGSNNNSGANAGAANTGGGSGAYEHGGPGGGSGVIILRMPTANYSGTTTGSPTVTTDGTDTVLTFTGSGTYTA